MQTTWYFIRSDSRPTLFHRVSDTAGRFVCECEDFSYRAARAGRDCRHIEQIKRGCGIVVAPKRRVTRGTGRPDLGCEAHTDCGYETAEHLGRGPHGDGYVARRPRPAFSIETLAAVSALDV